MIPSNLIEACFRKVGTPEPMAMFKYELFIP